MKLTFYGGAKQVTGANYLLEHGGSKILIDCGLHQGSNFCERHNWNPFPYRPSEISAVFVTHAHIDHTGLLPKLAREGFRGKIYATPPTRAAAEFLLADSDHILAQTAERFKKPILFNHDDVMRALSLWEGVSYHKPLHAGPFTATFYNAGHILGSSFISIDAGGERIIFSGDLGNSPAPLIGAREPAPRGATYCLVESTYGDRVHEALPERKEILEDVIEETVKRGGTLMIPAFAMERTQELLYELDELAREGRIPSVPIFLDSPLAIKLTEVYRAHDDYFVHGVERGKDLGHLFTFPNLTETLRTEDSRAINDAPPPKVIIAGSGMMHGGRILHHLKRYLHDANSTLFIVGFQASGSLGRRIFDGAETVKIFGDEVPVRARVKAIGAYSAHADQPQLLEWLSPMRAGLKRVFVVQGEAAASSALAVKIRDELAVAADIPDEGQEIVLS